MEKPDENLSNETTSKYRESMIAAVNHNLNKGLISQDRADTFIKELDINLSREMTPPERERITLFAKDHLKRGWIDQDEADKILAMKYFVEAEDYCEQRLSNYAFFGDLLDAGIINNEIADQIIKMNPYEGFEKIKEYEEKLRRKQEQEK